MVLGLVADANVKGHLAAIVRLCDTGELREFWAASGVELRVFEELGLRDDADDAAVWRLCQARSVLLVTGNRNQHGRDSLEAVIRREGTSSSLPVLTLSDPDRVMRDRHYAEQVADRLVEIVFDLDMVRGAGRLFLP